MANVGKTNLAALARETGINYDTLKGWVKRKDRDVPGSIKNAAVLARALGVSVEYLYDGTELPQTVEYNSTQQRMIVELAMSLDRDRAIMLAGQLSMLPGMESLAAPLELQAQPKLSLVQPEEWIPSKEICRMLGTAINNAVAYDFPDALLVRYADLGDMIGVTILGRDGDLIGELKLNAAQMKTCAQAGDIDQAAAVIRNQLGIGAASDQQS